MIYFLAFIFGGSICALAQIIKDFFKLTTAHVTAIFVVLGALLGINGLYSKLIKFVGCGATLPITNFGALLTKGAIEGAEESFFKIFTNVFTYAQAGLSLCLFLAIIIGFTTNPKR